MSPMRTRQDLDIDWSRVSSMSGCSATSRGISLWSMDWNPERQWGMATRQRSSPFSRARGSWSGVGAHPTHPSIAAKSSPD